MPKTQIRVTIDKRLAAEAKELGLNLSRTCERAIRMRVAALRSLEGLDDLEGAHP